MSQKSRQEVISTLQNEYAAASFKQKKILLDTLVQATGYNRKYAIQLLNSSAGVGRKVKVRPRKYDAAVTQALVRLWKASNYLCGKRLVAFIRHALPSIERARYLQLDSLTRAKLVDMSAATADRLLQKEKTVNAKSRGLTKAGSILRKHIQVRTFADWDDARPGFLEIDTVGHDGGNPNGNFAHTLTMTDVASGWTELIAMSRKTEEESTRGIEVVMKVLPFPLLGIDSDNGTEFMNYRLMDWCEQNNVTFTRSREYKKNDQCFVEEKNGSVVRKLVGHGRYTSPRSLHLLEQLYELSRLYVNFFQPSLKLVSKTREGSRVKRKYDFPQTPFERLMASSLPRARKRALQRQFKELNPIILLEGIRKLQLALAKSDNAKQAGQIVPLPNRRQNAWHTGLTAHIYTHCRNAGHGEVFAVHDLLQYGGTPGATRTILTRLVQKGVIEKCARGRYCRKDKTVTFNEMKKLRVTPKATLNFASNR